MNTDKLDKETIKHLFSMNNNYSINEIKKNLNIKNELDYNELVKFISELEEDGFIFEEDGKYSLLSKRDDLIQGRIRINSCGDGYITSNNETVRIRKEYIDYTLNGDLVLVKKCFYTPEGKVEGIINKIIKQDGLLILNYEDGKLIPYRNCFNYKIKLKKQDLDKLDNNTRIRVKINNKPNNGYVKADLIDIIGHKDDVYLEEKTIALENGFNIEFSKKAKKELENITSDIPKKEIDNRTDFRDKTIFTIDGADTKDMDDAISLDINDKGNYMLGVHIADVSYYVKPDSKIYEEAKERGTSVYINNTSIPMLPRKLSNDICSLNPNEDRLTKSILIEISKDGKIVNYEIIPSIIRSKIKMNYNDVNNLLENNIIKDEYASFKEKLLLMNELSKVLNHIKSNRGYLPFSETDVKTKYDKFGNSIDFSVNKQKSAESLIENFMLIANECIGNYFYNIDFPGIYRIHEQPDDEKLYAIINLINSLGYKTKTIKNFSNPRAIQGILKELYNEEEYSVLSDIILKGMKRAKYSTINVGHFGLALPKYIQFTSPIRRFPDLETHTLLNKILEADISINELRTLETDLENKAIHSSNKERAADKAEKEGLKMNMAGYMEKHIGEYFNGRISCITNLGVVVKTFNQIEGKVSLRNIKGDNYMVNENKTQICGKNKNEKYSIGDKVRVKVKNASKEYRTVEYELTENLSKKKTKCLKKT